MVEFYGVKNIMCLVEIYSLYFIVLKKIRKILWENI